MRKALLALVFVSFTAYSVVVVAAEGYLGFIPVAMGPAWGTQIFIDLVIALSLFATWMFPDAKKRGIPAWPYFLAILSLGSIGALAYLLHREFRPATV